MIPPRSEGIQYAIGEDWTVMTNRKNEAAGPKQKQYLVVDVAGGESNVQCCKEQYCKEPEMLGPCIKVNQMWSSRRWQD